LLGASLTTTHASPRQSVSTAQRSYSTLAYAPVATTLCILSGAPLYDAVLRESLSATLNVDLDDIRWNQASLPIRWGGLGVRGVVLMAPSAYLALAASTTELTDLIFCSTASHQGQRN